MSKLMNKIDFVALIAVDRANANGGIDNITCIYIALT